MGRSLCGWGAAVALALDLRGQGDGNEWLLAWHRRLLRVCLAHVLVREPQPARGRLLGRFAERPLWWHVGVRASFSNLVQPRSSMAGLGRSWVSALVGGPTSVPLLAPLGVAREAPSGGRRAPYIRKHVVDGAHNPVRPRDLVRGGHRAPERRAAASSGGRPASMPRGGWLADQPTTSAARGRSGPARARRGLRMRKVVSTCVFVRGGHRGRRVERLENPWRVGAGSLFSVPTL